MPGPALRREPRRPMRARVRCGSLAVIVGAGLALAGLAFACGSDDVAPPACTGVACDGGVDSTITPDGQVDASTVEDATSDGADAGDGSTVCPGPAGTLDPTFGDGGIVVLSYGSETATADAVAIQLDGKIVVGGVKTNAGQGFAVVRMTPDGVLDPTFGTAGLVETKVGNTSHVLRALALQPDGKILIAGYTRFVGQNFDFAVLRYSADGTLDPTFGAGGVVLTDFGGRTDQAMAMALAPGGRIVVGGQTLTDDLTVADMAFARYNADGSLDATFGVGGRTTVDIRGTPDQARSIVILPGGKIVAAGTSRDPAVSRLDIAAVKLEANGALDATFGAGGFFVSSFGGIGSDSANAAGLDSSGRVVLVGMAGGNDMGTVRLAAAGSLDSTFGTLGRARTDFEGRNDEGSALLSQADGKLLIAGVATNATSSDDRLALARHLPDGRLDLTFGSAGKVLTPLPAGFYGANVQAGAPASCSFTIVGDWAETATGVSRMVIARYRR